MSNVPEVPTFPTSQKSLANVIVSYIVKNDINVVFCVPGGFAMFLNHEFANNDQIQVIYMQHELACGYAAMGYAKITGNPACVCTTAGCGITNTISSINSAWQDSCPVLYICGQVKTEDCISVHKNKGINYRNIFGSDANICSIVKNICKLTSEPVSIEECITILPHAVSTMLSARKGPVVLSIPLDLQNKSIEYNKIKNLHSQNIRKSYDKIKEISIKEIELIKNLFKQSKKPILLIGGGCVSSSKMRSLINKYILENNLPSVFTFFSFDIIPTNSYLHCGRIGILGERCGNYLIQNCDLLLILGCRATKAHVGYNPKIFAPNAKIIHVDMDQTELNKQCIKIDIAVHSTIENFLKQTAGFIPNVSHKWMEECKHRRKQWLCDLPPAMPHGKISQYHFLNQLTKITSKKPTNYIACAGSLITTAYHVLSLSAGDRFITSNQGEMGFELPAAIGCALGNPNKRNIVLVGDGSFQFNNQELSTISILNSNIKILVVNNGGYASIANTQRKYFNSEYGCSAKSNLKMPNLQKMADAYDIRYKKLEVLEKLSEMNEILADSSPLLMEIICEPCERYPKLGTIKNIDGTITSRAFDDMEPFVEKKIKI